MTPPASTARFTRAATLEVEDVQARADTRQLPINRVGIKDINHPVRVKDRSAGEQHTIATFNTSRSPRSCAATCGSRS